MQILVRWNMEKVEGGALRPHEGYDTVEVVKDEVVIFATTFCNNHDRVIGCCYGLSGAYLTLGHEVRVPDCVRASVIDTTRQS